MYKIIIAIDPGQSGAIAYHYSDGSVGIMPMPNTIKDIYVAFGILKNRREYEVLAYMENVGGYVPGNSGPASVKFARHIGHLEMALVALKIPFEKVAPSTWMRYLGVPTKMAKGDRKRHIKDIMQRWFPNLRVDLYTADALGILVWAMEKGGIC